MFVLQLNLYTSGIGIPDVEIVSKIDISLWWIPLSTDPDDDPVATTDDGTVVPDFIEVMILTYK